MLAVSAFIDGQRPVFSNIQKRNSREINYFFPITRTAKLQLDPTINDA